MYRRTVSSRARMSEGSSPPTVTPWSTPSCSTPPPLQQPLFVPEGLGLQPESQGQNLALTVLCVPSSLDKSQHEC